ncbi:MAG: FecR domain-containing protein [Myxococcaceae bacterium]
MPRPDFHKALNEAARALDSGMPDEADRRIRARLNGEAPKPRRVQFFRVGLLAAGAAAAVVVTAFALHSSPVNPERLGGFALLGSSPDLEAHASADGRVELGRGECTLKDEWLGATLAVSGAAGFKRLPDGVEVASGRVELEVDPKAPRAGPYRVRVSHGVIEVLGTRFTVTQGKGGGEVSLERGSVRFLWDDGRAELLVPGGSLSWPLRPALAPPAPLGPEPQPPKPSPSPPGKPAPIAVRAPEPAAPPPEPPAPPAARAADPELLLNRIAVLRSRGQYEEAVAALSSALGEAPPASTRERLSYELGAILTRQLADKVRACAHWQAHLEGFPDGRYGREVSQAREELRCPPAP